jgi:hypothetical protein
MTFTTQLGFDSSSPQLHALDFVVVKIKSHALTQVHKNVDDIKNINSKH